MVVLGGLGVLSGATVAPVAGVLAMGLFDSVLGDDEPAETEEATDGGESLFEEPADDGDLDDLGDDAFGDLEDAGDDEREETNTGELDARVDDLENEVADISSTMSTVRSENEAMSDTVEEVEENVRKLLDIYEMVTKGVNPFVDEAPAGNGGFDGGDDFGLFAAEEDEEADLDDDVADAEAESFFDEDFDGPDGEAFDADDGAFEDAGGDGGAFDGGDDDSEGDDAGGGDATTFDQLKEEYESGDADWAEEADETDGTDDTEEPADAISEDADTDLDFDAAGSEDADLAFDEEPPTDDSPQEPVADDSSEDPDDEPPRATTESADEPLDEETTDSGGGDADAGDSDAYLETLPETYAAELLVMEWTASLVETGGVRGTLEAIDYYEEVGWVGPQAADQLRAVTPGLGADGGDASLGPADHRRSLEYISHLGGVE